AARTLGAAIERRTSERRLEQQLRRLGGLRAINVAITASLDVTVTLDVFLEQAIAQLQVDAADVLLLRPQSGALEFGASRGFRSSGLQHTRLRIGEGHAGRAVLERRSVRIDDLRREPLSRATFLKDDEFVTYLGLPLLSKGQVRGVLELFSRVSLPTADEWLDFASTLAAQAAVAIDNALLFDDLQRSNLELTLAYDTTLEGWSRAMDLRDRETEGHTQRVTELTLRLGRTLGMSDSELVHVRRGALLHDIGKMGIPDRILLKPGPLTEEEWDVMRLHPVYALELLAPISFLRPALDIPYCHHERWDGAGYPRGIRGETIPGAARAFAVVDVWDALRSDRPYRAAWPEERVREHVASLAGTHLDPQAVDAFLSSVEPEVRAGGLPAPKPPALEHLSAPA
ncbi:MAG: HD-GYP domain-containing protein, partial [Gaiellaceae bacterium]